MMCLNFFKMLRGGSAIEIMVSLILIASIQVVISLNFSEKNPPKVVSDIEMDSILDPEYKLCN